MTVHQWGESPKGIWELEIHNKGKYMGEFDMKINIQI
jgi:subtilisin-like proprotein convertase family protein